MIKTEAEFNEATRLLDGDLRTLFKLVFTSGDPVEEGDIRAASVILRKWLIDRLLLRVCRAARLTPTFFVLDNNKVLEALPRQPSINYFLTGGVRFDGTAVQGVYNSNARSIGTSLLPNLNMPVAEYTFGRFMRQKRLFFEGTFFTCEEIIRYTANKLGGAHLDFARDGRLNKLDAAASFMKYGGPLSQGVDPGCDIYLTLERTGAEILSALHIEIIAAASSFLQMRLNGRPLAQLEERRSLLNRAKSFFGRKENRVVIWDYDQEGRNL